MPADAGIKFGSYVLLRRIARGGMAEVFLAQQRGLEGFDRRVAVKRILPHLADSPDFVKMFLGEAKLAAQLSHPNVVHIYEFGKVDHDYFIAMEFVDGVHAGQIWKHGDTHDRMTPTLIARIGADAATALHHAHELRNPSGKLFGLVHRDVSPANIMISYDGVVKLCDFGIAKAAALTDQLTSPGQVKGKYAYMSPEQTIAQPLDGRSDVFSLAIVLWELLSGRFIVQRGDAVAAMRAIRDGKIDPISQVAPTTPPALAKAISWALEPRREKRATAAELAQALEAFIKSSPEIANSMQLGAWVRQRFVREHTGQMQALAPSGGGTQVAAPGTVASPPTGASDHQSAVTPQPALEALIGASKIAALSDRPMPTETHDTDEVPARGPSAAGSRASARTPTRDRFTPASGTDTTKIKPFDAANTHAVTAKKLDAPKMPRSAPSEPTARPYAAPGVPPPRSSPTAPTARPFPAPDVATPTPVLTPTAKPFAPTSGSMTIAKEPIQIDATTIDKPLTVTPDTMIDAATRAAEEPTMLARDRPMLPPDAETSDARETVELAGARVVPMSSGPAIVQTAFVAPLSGPRPRVSDAGPMRPPAMEPSGEYVWPLNFLTRRRRRAGGDPKRDRRVRFAILGAGLFGLALISFLIALAASGSHKAAVPLDAQIAVVPASDAAQLATISDADVADAPRAPTFPVDAQPEAYLEVSTMPDAGKIKVGDQVRTAPAQIIVAAGTMEVTAELPGYQLETRTVVIEPGEHQKIEIAFTHKMFGGHPVAAAGKLSVRTTPYAEVFENGKKIAETPFADREMTAGVHTLTFKNPAHATFTKKITITAGKPTKLSFALP